MNLVKSLIKDESGVTLVEYGLVTAAIATVGLAVITNVGQDTQSMFHNACLSMSGGDVRYCPK